MSVRDLVKSVKAANLEKYQLTEILYKRLLMEFGYPVDDDEKLVRDYECDSSDTVVDFVYIDDGHPEIAIFVEDVVDGDILSDRVQEISKDIDNMFLLTLSGELGRLYYRGDRNGSFHPVRTKTFTENTIKRAHEFSPEYILSRDVDYWEDIVNKELYKRVEKSKFKCKLNIIDTLNELYPNQISQRNIDDILKIIIGDKKVEEDEYGSYSKLLSEIEYDTDLRHTTITSVLIGEEEYPSITYLKLMRELVRYMEKFVNSDNIHKIKNAGLHKGTCQMKDKISELSPSYRNSHVVLGNTYIGRTSTGSAIINTTKRLFDILGIDQDTVLLEWIDDNAIDTSLNEEVVEYEDVKEGRRVILTDVTNVNDFTFSQLKKAEILGEELVSPSYSELVIQVARVVKEDNSKEVIDRTLSRQKVLERYIAPDYHKLNHTNKRDNCRLGSYYVGLSYTDKTLLTILILICEIFDINQDEIILYLG